MLIKKIDGTLFEQLIKYSLQNLAYYEQDINKINVFPVSDGDTGTNMRFTLENGINSALSTKKLCDYLKNLSKGLLFGARGNSGVILSQIFKGFYSHLQNKEEISVEDFAQALSEGSKTAYQSVINPVEGTILTVTRESIVSTLAKISPETDLLSFFEIYLSYLSENLKKTPDYLPILKTNNVVDSGGLGYFRIIEGMKKYLTNEDITVSYTPNITLEAQNNLLGCNFTAFTKDSDFHLGYCLEFILQVLEAKFPVKNINLQQIIKDLKTMGDSLVAVLEDSLIKIHIHVKDPVPVISYILKYGEFISFKLDNMQLQHNETFSKIKKDLCIISVVNNPDIKNLFSDLGCDYIIDDESLQNTTAADFIKAIELFDAKEYLILPNNKNLIASANQAKEILEAKNITILNTTDICQGYYALAMDDIENSNIEFRKKQMLEGFNYIQTILVTTAIKSSIVNNLKITNGDKVFIHQGEIIHNSKDISSGLIDSLKKIDMTDKSSFVLFFNDNITDSLSNKVSDLLSNQFPEIQQSILKNSNSLYDIILGVF